MTRHPYNNPRLNAIEFLFAVMHDPELSLDLRMEAANSLLSTDVADLPADRGPAIIYRFADYQEHKENNDERAA